MSVRPPEPELSASNPECKNHPGTPGVFVCIACREAMCNECRRQVGQRLLCPACAASPQGLNPRVEKDPSQKTSVIRIIFMALGGVVLSFMAVIALLFGFFWLICGRH